MSYTERFSERWALLASIEPASYTTEQNTGAVACQNYTRLVVIIHCGVIGGDLDIDIEEATSITGTLASFDSGNKDVTKTATTDNDTVSVIEIRGEEFDVNNVYGCLNVEVTPASAGIFSGQLWGQAVYPPASTTNLDSVTD